MDTSLEQPRSDAGRLQFSLASLFVFVTGICIALSLVRWRTTFGLMASILIVAGGWSFAARRAGYYRLAYTLASAALGEVGHLVLMTPLIFLPRDEIWRLWFHPGAVSLMTVSTVLAAAILRRAILAEGPMTSLYDAYVGGVYLTSIIFPIVWGLALLAMAPSGEGLIVIVLGVVVGIILATLTMPLSLPLAVVCCWVLRAVDPWRAAKEGPLTLKSKEAVYVRGTIEADVSDVPAPAQTVASREG
jgi:hypothetical protein